MKRALLEMLVPGALVMGLCFWCCHELWSWDLSEMLQSRRTIARPEYRVCCLDWGHLSIPMDIDPAGCVAGVQKNHETGQLLPIMSDAQSRLLREKCSGENVLSISMTDTGRVAVTTDSRPRIPDNRQVYLIGPEEAEVQRLGPTQAGRLFSAYAISDPGMLVGAIRHDRSKSTWQAAAFSAESGIVQIDTAPSCAFDVNERGQIVGCAEAEGGQVARLWERDSSGAWSALDITEPSRPTTRAIAVNENGVVVGWVSANRAFIWDRQAGLRALPPPRGCQRCRATALNNRGMVVGSAAQGDGSTAVIWRDGQPADLNTLIDPASPYRLWQAHAINDDGLIACTAWCGESREAVVLVPLK